VPAMHTQWSGAAGRYQARCEQGHCALTGGQATSKLQGQIFTLLDYVLGPGKPDVRTWAGRLPLRIDMVFTLPSGEVLALEYDGAYWHRDQEERDSRKTHMIEGKWWDRACIVMRIREDPLAPLGPADIQVPARAGATTCARLILLHLIHMHMLPYDLFERAESFLRASPHLLALSDIRCPQCLRVVRGYLPAEVISPPSMCRGRPQSPPVPGAGPGTGP
jgi:hypothetical protein